MVSYEYISFSMKKKPFISVVVPAYNEENWIGKCLLALSAQNIPQREYEIIVVDNNSTDKTGYIAKKHHTRVVKENRKGNVYALITGIRRARGDIILLTDADTVVPESWIREYRTFFESHPLAVGATGPFRYTDGATYVQIYTKTLNRLCPRLLVSTMTGTNMGFRRDAYRKVGGFDPEINLQGDSNIGYKFQKIGYVGFLSKNSVQTSGRRFPNAFMLTKEIIMRILNHLHIRFTNKAVVFDFDDIRT